MPWSDSRLTPQFNRLFSGRLLAGLFLLLLSLLLSSCASLTQDPPSLYSDDYARTLLQLKQWTLRGRLNIRSTNQSDTININWQQQGPDFDINLSGTLGIGAVRINSNSSGVIIEKAGEDPIMASSLQELSSELLGYAFPANSLLHWIKGLPAPNRNSDITRTHQGLVATLSQTDNQGTRWEIQYDRYQDYQGAALPGRIRLEQPPYRLTFIINAWETDVPNSTRKSK